MGIRGRLLVAMGYVGLTVVVALAVPLSATLERRARTALENRNLVRATALAQRLNDWSFTEAGLPSTQTLVDRAADRFDGRVLVVDAVGAIVADSGGAAAGTPYATAGRPEIRRALGGNAWSSVRYSTDLGMDLMATSVPIVEEVEGTGAVAVLGAIRITQTMREADEAVRRTTIGLVGLGATALAAALGLAWFLAGSIARPLRSLATTAHRFGGGDLAARAGAVGTTTELVEVATSFDAMADRMERLVRAQRDFVADASHQIRTPLTGVRLQLEEAIAADPTGPAATSIRAAEREVDRLTQIVSRLLTKAAGEGAPKEAIAGLRAVADRAQARWKERVAREERTLVVEGNEVRVLADEAVVDEICDTLLDNALHHGDGPIVIAVDVHDDRGRLRVMDRGPGVHPEDRDRVIERFERGRDTTGAGTGLGLAIARELAERWGGQLGLDSAAGVTTAAVRFRLASRGAR